MRQNLARFVPALLFACALPLAAQAAGADSATSRQVATATAHAGMALGASDLGMVHVHLHHVVNCLVGPAGKAFDAKAGDPCKGMGQGAIVDAKGDAATEARLHTAVSEAEQGLSSMTVEGAHADAQKVLGTLQSR